MLKIKRLYQQSHRTYNILEDVLGPDGPGPSSSHTMAPLRAAYMVYCLLGSIPTKAKVILYNSFATTSEGHRTPTAIYAGLLGLSLTDPRIPSATLIAAQHGFSIQFEKHIDENEHPNAIVFDVQNEAARIFLKIISIGGGLYQTIEYKATPLSLKENTYAATANC